jgi:hypothetical protein
VTLPAAGPRPDGRSLLAETRGPCGSFGPLGSIPPHSKDDSSTPTRRQNAATSGGATPGGRGLLLLFAFRDMPRRAEPDATDEARRSLSRRQDGFDPRRMCRQQVSHPGKYESVRQDHGVRGARPACHQGHRGRKGTSTGLLHFTITLLLDQLVQSSTRALHHRDNNIESAIKFSFCKLKSKLIKIFFLFFQILNTFSYEGLF